EAPCARREATPLSSPAQVFFRVSGRMETFSLAFDAEFFRAPVNRAEIRATPRLEMRTRSQQGRPRVVTRFRSDSRSARTSAAQTITQLRDTWRLRDGPALLAHGAEALLGAFELVERLLQLGEPIVLPLHDLGPRLAQEVLVPELPLHQLEVREQLLRLAGEPRPFLVEIDEPVERQEHLRALDDRGRRHRRPRPVAGERQPL